MDWRIVHRVKFCGLFSAIFSQAAPDSYSLPLRGCRFVCETSAQYQGGSTTEVQVTENYQVVGSSPARPVRADSSAGERLAGVVAASSQPYPEEAQACPVGQEVPGSIPGLRIGSCTPAKG